MTAIDSKAITYSRIFATISILLCHLVQLSSHSAISALGQLFNVGVQIFLIISGFLYGRRVISERTTYRKWIFTRMKKILIPMYLVVLIILIGQLINGTEIKISHYIAYFFNLQGLEIYIQGGEHLWYLTVAMICYLITPILEKNRSRFCKNSFCILFATIYAIAQLGMTYWIYRQFGIYMILIGVYIAAYVIGIRWDCSIVNVRMFVLSLGASLLAMVARIVFRFVMDNTTFYEVIVAGYSQYILALAIFFVIFYIISKINNREVPRLALWFSGISYEVYLIHYMFIHGPYYLLFTDSIVINCLIIVIATLICAFLLNMIVKLIIKVI